MENLDIIIFTAILIVSFIILIIGTFMEFQKMNTTTYNPNEKSGGAKSFLNFIARIFTG
jgi:hypothetical protein